MKILINCSNLKMGGGLQVANSFLYEINHNNNHEFVVVISENLAEIINTEDFSSNFKFINYNIKPSLFKILTGNDPFLNKIEEEYKPDRVFSVFGSTYWKPKAKHICGFAKPGYIYKESPYFTNLKYSQRLLNFTMEKVHMYDFLHNNDILITENEDVTIRLKNIIKKEVKTVSNFYNQIFKDRSLWISNSTIDIDDGIVKLLTISANYAHKNLNIVPEVILYLKSTYPDFNFKFYLTIDESEFSFINDLKILDHIRFLGKVKINECPELYSKCDYLFLPTLLECFSASYCEAMFMELPILTSDLGFARGICEDAAVYFDPMSASSIGDAIFNLHHNKKLILRLKNQGLLQLKKFDTSEMRAKKYLEIICS